AFPGRQKKVGFDSVLLGVQVVITSTEGVKGLVGSALNNAPRLHHQDLICASNRRKPVRDYKRRAPAHEVAQALLNQRLRFRVQAGSRFVEDRDPRLGHNRPRDSLTWFMSALSLSPALANDRV